MGAIHDAARKGDVAGIEYLITDFFGLGFKKAVFLEKDQEGRMAAHWAAANGHLNVLEYLIKIANENNISLRDVLFQKDNKDQSTLFLAAENGHLEVFNYLKPKAGKADKCNLFFDSDKEDVSLMQAAISRGHFNIVTQEIEQGVIPSEKNKKDWTYLHFAAYYGHLEFVLYFVNKCRLSLNAVTTDGETVFDLANKCDNQEAREKIVAFLDEAKNRIPYKLEAQDIYDLSMDIQYAPNKKSDAELQNDLNNVNGDIELREKYICANIKYFPVEAIGEDLQRLRSIKTNIEEELRKRTPNNGSAQREKELKDEIDRLRGLLAQQSGSQSSVTVVNTLLNQGPSYNNGINNNNNNNGHLSNNNNTNAYQH